MYLTKNFDIERNDGNITIQALVRIEGDAQHFRITLREKGTSSLGCILVLDESEVHSFAKMFNELSDDAVNGYPEYSDEPILDGKSED